MSNQQAQQKVIRDAPRRMGANERWEYQCLTCKEWQPPGKFRKRGKDKSKPCPTCKGCEQRAAKWEAESKGRQLAATAWRRERMMRCASQPADLIRPIYAEAARRTAETGTQHHVDHEIPLKAELACGLHVAANLQILTGAENASKGNRFTPYYQTPDGHRRYIEEDPAYVFDQRPRSATGARIVRVVKQ